MNATPPQQRYVKGLTSRLAKATGVERDVIAAGVEASDPASMSSSDANAAIKLLLGQLAEINPDLLTPSEWDQADRERKRAKMGAIAVTMGWSRRGKADFKRINDWACKYGKFEKDLQQHTSQELNELITQFEKVARSYIQK